MSLIEARLRSTLVSGCDDAARPARRRLETSCGVHHRGDRSRTPMDSSTRPSMLSSPPPIPSDSDVDRRRASCSHSRNIASFTIARGRRWLDEVVSGRVTTVAQLCAREKCSVRQVNMTISLAFLAPNLVKAAVEGRLPRGIGVERLRDPPTEWSRQFEALGLNPE